MVRSGSSIRSASPNRATSPACLGRKSRPNASFGRPIVDGDHAVVPWSAQTKLVDGGTEDLAGVSLLRFDASGLVLEHRDFWSGASRRSRALGRPVARAGCGPFHDSGS